MDVAYFVCVIDGTLRNFEQAIGMINMYIHTEGSNKNVYVHLPSDNNYKYVKT